MLAGLALAVSGAGAGAGGGEGGSAQLVAGSTVNPVRVLVRGRNLTGATVAVRPRVVQHGRR